MARIMRRERILGAFRSRVMTLTLIVIAGAVCLALGREAARRVAVQQEIDRLTKDITVADQSTKELDHLLATLKSSTFEEGAARTYLNLQKPGEKVLVVPDSTTNSATVVPGASTEPSPQKAPTKNTKRWWDFIFHSS